MPRPWHAQGRPDTQVIPGDWSTTHAPVVTKTLRGKCKLFPAPTAQNIDPDTGLMTAITPEPLWSGPCRVQALAGQPRPVVAAEDREIVVDFLVVIPLNTPTVPAGTRIDVTDSEDPALTGLQLLVEQAVAGTERFERDLFCSVAT